jgi:DNA-binding beta-propeller fold protein YncE
MTMIVRPTPRHSRLVSILGPMALLLATVSAPAAEPHRFLYVAEPGIRNYLEYGGHGVLVYDIDAGHKFLRRIKTTTGLDPRTGQPENVKGICASARTGRLYVTTIRTLTCYDLRTEKVLWEREYPDGCDRMAIAPDGSVLYVPTLEKDHWTVVEALEGKVLAKIVTKSGTHNTVYGRDGKHVYLAGLRSPMLTVAATADHDAERLVGPFSAPIRPLTVDGRQRYVYVNVNGLLGFEVGDLATNKKIHRVEVQGFSQGPTKRHGCPSHGIGLTPDEKELWVVDAFNQRVHVFDATVMPPKQVASIALRDEPGWVTFTIDGQYAYPSTGDVVDVKTRKIVAVLKDEAGVPIESEKMVEIDFDGVKPVRAGDQFGVGRVTAPCVAVCLRNAPTRPARPDRSG